MGKNTARDVDVFEGEKRDNKPTGFISMSIGEDLITAEFIGEHILKYRDGDDEENDGPTKKLVTSNYEGHVKYRGHEFILTIYETVGCFTAYVTASHPVLAPLGESLKRSVQAGLDAWTDEGKEKLPLPPKQAEPEQEKNEHTP